MASIKNDKLIDTMSGHFVKSYSSGYHLSNAVSMYLSLPLLRGFWPFSSYDENDDLYDLSGQGRVMTSNNLVGLTGMQKIIPYADFIRANSQNFSRIDEAGLSITDSLGLICWCYFDAESTGVETGLISKWTATGGNDRSYALIKTNTNTFRFQISDDGTNEYVLDSTVSYTESKWHFIAAGFYPSTYMYIFVNGTWVEDTTGIPASIYNNNSPLYFGTHWGGSYLDGRMALTALHKLPDNNYITVIESLYYHTRALFGVRS